MERRLLIYNIVVVKMQYKLFYIESICNNTNIIESNIKVSNFGHNTFNAINSCDLNLIQELFFVVVVVF